MTAKEQNACLILQNGAVFSGKSFGAKRDVTGELVFTTAMTGYLETLTDPSYYGQIVVQTFPLIGNYGVIPADFEHPCPSLKAYIVRDWCQDPSNFRSEGELDTFLKRHDITGLYGIDTRALTRIVREAGVMNAKIVAGDTVNLEEHLKEIKAYRVRGAVDAVSPRQRETKKAGQSRFKVALWDFGAKENIRRELIKRGCEVVTLPARTTAQEIFDEQIDGVMLSNGPGDPAENKEIIGELKKVCDKKLPVFGICLGHQLLALSQGAKTEKLKYGHRGANQPALNTKTGRVYITSQNHGYTVVSDTLPGTAYAEYVNANDGTCEGITYENMPAFSVQFHPEASSGPCDTSFLFDRFLDMMKGADRNAAE